MDAEQEHFAAKSIEMAEIYRYREIPRDGWNPLAVAAEDALAVGLFYTGLMSLVFWSSPWWTRWADWVVGR